MVIHRTILKELLVNILVIIPSLSLILFMEKFVRITQFFMGKSADLADIFKIFIYLQPSVLMLSVPMAILISIFLVYGRMATDSEIVVLKSCGMSFSGIAKAAIWLSSVCAVLLLFVSLYLLPRGMVSFKKILYETIVKKASMIFEEETFSEAFSGNIIYVKEIAPNNEFSGIFVYRDADSTVKGPVVIAAEKGVISSNPEEGLIKMTMRKGMIHTFDQKSSSEMNFSQYDLILTTGAGSAEKTRPDEIKTMKLWNGRSREIWASELHRRLALPFACIIFGVLATSLSSRMGKIGRLGGISLSMGILISYYLLLITGESLVKAGKMPPFVGGWGPNILFGLIAAGFFNRAYKDRPIRNM